MPRDALDPGPDGTYPAFPRRPDGRPDFERAGWPPGANAEFDRTGEVPSGLTRMHDPDGRPVTVDLTLRDQEGRPVVPPPSG